MRFSWELFLRTVFTPNATVNGYLLRMPFTPWFSCTIFITYIAVMHI